MRQPMSRADRAKQFMPFAALKGYDEALNRKARIPQARILLAEDAQTELDEKLRSAPGAVENPLPLNEQKAASARRMRM